MSTGIRHSYRRVSAYAGLAVMATAAALIVGFSPALRWPSVAMTPQATNRAGALHRPKNLPLSDQRIAVPPFRAAIEKTAGAATLATRLDGNYGKLPLSFEPNQGQTDQSVQFLSHGRGYGLFLTGNEAVLTLKSPSSALRGPLSSRDGIHGRLPRRPDSEPRTANAILRMKLLGANPDAAVRGGDELPGKVNYFLGNDSKKWRTNVPTYAQVRYTNAYPGIDLVYYGNQGGQLEYDFVVGPGANPAAIAMDVTPGLPRHPSAKNVGVKPPLQINSEGDLVVHLPSGDVQLHKPVIYQEQSAVDSQQLTVQNEIRNSKIDDRKLSIVNRQFREGHYVLTAANQVRFAVGPYDHSQPLFIDPVLTYSTFLGGTQPEPLVSGRTDAGVGVAIDSLGNAYVTGFTESIDFPTVGPVDATFNGGADNGATDAFVVKLNAAGSALVYSTYLGGTSFDLGQGIAVDSSGEAYVTGYTNSADFPTVNSLQACGACYPVDGSNVFVAKLNEAGSALLYSTYLGGSSFDWGQSIALDSSRNAYVTGYTQSTNFPTKNPLQGATNSSITNAFVTELNAAGSALVYSTYLGGKTNGDQDYAEGIAVDSTGAYVTGWTTSPDFPTVNPFQASLVSYPNAFVTKLNSTGSALVYSTYLGGGGDKAYGIAIDSSGNAYVTGITTSADFPTQNPIQATCAGCSFYSSAFVSKLTAAGSALVYSTYLGGSSYNAAYGIAVDPSGNAYVTGQTFSTDFPTVNPVQAICNNCAASDTGDAFVTKLNAAGSALIYSTYLGGSSADVGAGIAVDSTGDAYVTGQTYSTNFPTVKPLQATCAGCTGGTSNLGETTYTGYSDAFVTKFSPAPTVTLSANSLNFGSWVVGTTSGEQSVTLTNIGDESLSLSTITAGGGFALATTATSCPYTGGTVASEATCTIDVTFTPMASGPLTGSVTITDNDNGTAGSTQTFSLTGTGTAPIAGVSLGTLTFSSQAVGTTSASQPVTLSNTGTAALTIASITAGGDFSQTNSCGGGVAISGSCTINVTFTPTTNGTRPGTLIITDNNNGTAGSTQSVSLTGTGTTPVAGVSPGLLTFSSQLMDTASASQPVTLSNTGTATLTIASITTGGDFSQTNTCGGSVVGGSSCTISVTFTPTATGARSGSLTVTDNNNAVAGSTQSVKLTGTGTAPIAGVSLGTLTFSSQAVGTTSASQPVTLSNTGTAALTIASITAGGDFSQTNSCGGGVAINGSCTINVTFTPTATGPRGGTLTITDNNNGTAGNTQTVSLTGTGITPVAGVSPGTLTFGSQLMGTASASQPVTLSNTGMAALTIASITAGGDFSQTNTCGGSVAGGGSCTISVTFTPTATGTRPGTLTITDNNNGTPGSTQTVSLTGTGQPRGMTPAFQQVPGSLSSIAVGSDGTVWGINGAGAIWIFNPQAQTWQQASGSLAQIAVGASGFVWGLNSAGEIYRYNPGIQSWDPIPGNLSQIAVGGDGDVWGINSNSQIYHFDATAQGWIHIPGALTQIAVGFDGAVWGINAAQQIYRFNPGTQNWQQAPGNLAQIAVGADGDVWGINSASQILHFNSLTQNWDNIPGSLTKIAVGSGNNVWGINAQQQIYEFNSQMQSWEQIPGLLTQIAVGANGAVWGVNAGQQIYQFVQPTQPTQTFHQLPGLLAQIAVGLDGEVWGLNGANQIYAFNLSTQNWNPIPGALTQIALGFGGNIWGINAAGQIWRFNAQAQTWEQIPGELAQIAVGANGDVWGINSASQIYRFNPSLQNWYQIPGSLTQLSVGADGTVWGINSAQAIYRFNPQTQNLDSIPGSLTQIAVGSASNVWGINDAGLIWRYDGAAQSWDSIPGSLADIGVAFDGTVWGINSTKQIYRYNTQTQNWDPISGSLTQIAVGADALVWGLNASRQIYDYR